MHVGAVALLAAYVHSSFLLYQIRYDDSPEKKIDMMIDYVHSLSLSLSLSLSPLLPIVRLFVICHSISMEIIYYLG